MELILIMVQFHIFSTIIGKIQFYQNIWKNYCLAQYSNCHGGKRFWVFKFQFICLSMSDHPDFFSQFYPYKIKTKSVWNQNQLQFRMFFFIFVLILSRFYQFFVNKLLDTNFILIWTKSGWNWYMIWINGHVRAFY